MQGQDSFVNENETYSDKDSIQRCPHDEENPYAQISRSLIRDNSISPECRWMIIYFLSMKDGWKINIGQLVIHLSSHMGRKKVYDLVNEAMDAGYMKREQKTASPKHGGKLSSGFIYFVSETPKFKKFHRRDENRDAGSRDSGFGHIKKEHSSKKEHKNKKEHIPPTPKGDAPAEADGEDDLVDKSPTKKSEISCEAILLTDRIITILKKHNEFYRAPKNLMPSLSAVHELLKGGSLDPNKVIEVLEYAVQDTVAKGQFPGWSVVVYAKMPIIKFCEKIGTISQSMKSKPKKAFCPSSDDAKARKCAEEMMENAL